MGRVCRNLSLAAIVAALSLPGLADAKPKEPLRLKPSSKWLVNYAEDSCRMARNFGEGDQKVLMVADRFEPGDTLRISFYGKPARTSRLEGNAQIRFGPTEAMQQIPFYPGKGDGKLPALVLRTGVRIAPYSAAELAADEAARDAGNFSFAGAGITPDQEAAVTFIEVGRPANPPFILETGSLGKPLAALRQCTDELLDHWGIDVAKHARLTRAVTPKSNPARWMHSDDYPREMLLQGQRALVQFRLNVDATGKPTACHIQQSTRPKEFDDAVCKVIMRNAEFEPALDADGHPIASYWLNSVNFHI